MVHFYKRHPFLPGLITIAGGFGGAFLLLLGFWRPKTTKDTEAAS
jgi:hypothetical protein